MNRNPLKNDNQTQLCGQFHPLLAPQFSVVFKDYTCIMTLQIKNILDLKSILQAHQYTCFTAGICHGKQLQIYRIVLDAFFLEQYY